MECIDLSDSTLCRICLKRSNETTSIFNELEICDDRLHMELEQGLQIVDLIIACSSIEKVRYALVLEMSFIFIIFLMF